LWQPARSWKSSRKTWLTGGVWSRTKQERLACFPERTTRCVHPLLHRVCLAASLPIGCQFTSDFTTAPDLELPLTDPHSHARKLREASDHSVTPRASPSRQLPSLPIVPQNTGEWLAFPSFRQSLLGGKSINRFSSFVTSGAEEWVLKGTAADVVVTTPTHDKWPSEDSDITDDQPNEPGRIGEADQHFVDAGPSWKSKLPSFCVLVHSPSKRSSLAGAYTVFSVTSLFHLPALSEASENSEAQENSGVSPTRVTVQRRFSHFVILHTALTRRLPGIALPPLPEKQYAGRFSDEFVEARRSDLERYINRVVRHPIARYAEILTFFLGCDNDMVQVPQLI
jgi:sorting nexin-9/18/33